MAAAAAAKSFQSCPTPCDPTDSSPPGSHVPGILQAGTLEWVAIGPGFDPWVRKIPWSAAQPPACSGSKVLMVKARAGARPAGADDHEESGGPAET